MKLKEALDLTQSPAVISIVGGGGKTTTMYALADELAREGARVLVTTTTAFYYPDEAQVDCVIIEKEEESLYKKLESAFKDFNKVAAAKEFIRRDKVVGFSPNVINNLAEKRLFDYVLIEADGSRGRSLKGYRDNEPVVPKNTTHLIMVVGIDCIGKQLNETWVHRPEVVVSAIKKSMNSVITVNDVAQILIHPKGFLKALPANAKSFVLINKADDDKRLKLAVELGKKVLEQQEKNINKVIIAHMRESDPVISVHC